MKNIQTLVQGVGGTLNSKFGHNYSSNNLQQNNSHKMLHRQGPAAHHSQSHAQMTTQSSSPQYASAGAAAASKPRYHAKNSNVQKKKTSLKGVQSVNGLYHPAGVSYN